MGILSGSKAESKTTGSKRRSTQLDFSGLGPLKTSGTVGFSAFRDQEDEQARRRGSGKSNGAMDDSDDDDSDGGPLVKMEDTDDKIIKTQLGPEDAKVTGELQAGIDRIRVCQPKMTCLCFGGIYN